MSSPQATFMSGRVWKRSLPVISGAPAADAPSLKRLMLSQGELAQLHDADEPIHYLAFIELKQGSVRGNHFHNVKQEFVYIIDGDSLLDLEDTVTKARDTVRMRAGDLAFIPPGIAHALRVIEPGHGVEFSPNRFNADDIHRYTVVSAGS